MRRAFSFLLVGLVLGVALTYVARRESDAPVVVGAGQKPSAVSETASNDRSPSTTTIDFLTLLMGSVSVPERAAIYAVVARADRATVESLVAQVEALPDMEGRRVALEALLGRYAELDGPAALRFARERASSDDLVVSLLEQWARSDVNGALRALRELDSATAVALGVAILNVIGNDRLGIARVLGAAPQVDSDSFRVAAAIAKANVDPAGAFEDALALPATKGSAALTRIAAIWVERDVYEALARAATITDEAQRAAFRASAFRAWATREPEAALAYLLELDTEAEQVFVLGALEAFMEADPERALTAAARLPGNTGSMLRQAALMSMARGDPAAALRHVETLPPSNERDQMLAVVATFYGRSDPEGALAWARSLDPPMPDLVANVVAGLARVDAARAIDIVFAEIPRNAQHRALQAMLADGSLSAERAAAIVDRLHATPGRGPEARMAVRTWAQRAPLAAATWAAAQQPEAAAASAVDAALQPWVRRDAPAARKWAQALPPGAARDAALVQLLGAASDAASFDETLLDSFSSRAALERGVSRAILAIAPRDPAAARDLAERHLTDPALRQDALQFVERPTAQ